MFNRALKNLCAACAFTSFTAILVLKQENS